MRTVASPNPRMKLTPALLGYLLTDLFGMVLIAQGSLFLVTGAPLLDLAFPLSFLGALVCIVAGFVLLFWALARVLVTVAIHPMAPPP